MKKWPRIGVIKTNDIAKKLAEGVSKSPEYSYKRCNKRFGVWRRIPLNKWDDMLVDSVAKSPTWSYYAGKDWNGDRSVLKRYGDKLAESVAKSPKWSFRAGDKWSDKYFDKYADKLVEGIKGDIEFLYLACVNWEKERFALCLDGNLKELYLNTHRSVYSRTFSDFLENTSLDLMNNLTNEDFFIASEAYDFAKQTKQKEATDAFLDGFKEVLKQGNVRPWAKTIIKSFRDQATGGSNYRIESKRLVS